MNLRNFVNGSVFRRAVATVAAAATVFAGSNALAVSNIMAARTGTVYKSQTLTVQEGNLQVVYDVYYADGVEIQRVARSSTEIQQPSYTPAAVPAAAPAVSTDGVPVIGTKDKASDFTYQYVIECTATAYDPSPEENGGWGGMSATGVPLQPGIIAVDPSVIPLGSKVYVEALDGSWTYGYALAADTGGAIKGNRVDLLFLTKGECYDFGRRQCRVYVL